ncbi:MAG: ribosomal protein S18-alanine N-acetyltransferase [Oscillospiraceae bacterium]|nr:ribosomal protein S18-alanine N-acetyltransferase [Oscillospiraceae bacterium]
MDVITFITHAESVCFAHPWTRGEVQSAVESEYGVFAVEPETGYALGRLSFDEAELYRIAVLPEKRRNGVGGRLLDSFISACRGRGAEKIFLEVRSKNEPAIKLYESRGFALISVRKGYYGDDDALIYMLPEPAETGQ